MGPDVKVTAKFNSQDVVLTTTTTGGAIEIPYGEFSKGIFTVTTIGSGCTTASFYAADQPTNYVDGVKHTGVYGQLFDPTGTTAKSTILAAGNSYPLPTEAAGAGSLIITINGGTCSVRVTRVS